MTLETDRPDRAAAGDPWRAATAGSSRSLGVYGGFIDKFPMGAFMNRSLTMRTGQCHVQRYMKPLLERIHAGEIDPSFVITHRMPLEDAPKGLRHVRQRKHECEKVVLKAA